MTALAMIIGMAPMALGLGEGGEQNAPLGRAVIGGLVFATVATLMFVPVVFSILHDVAARWPPARSENRMPPDSTLHPTAVAPRPVYRRRRRRRVSARSRRHGHHNAQDGRRQIAANGPRPRRCPSSPSRCRTRTARTTTFCVPGRLEAYTQAQIYARVSGYVKDWKADIGTPVKAGQLLAEIDAPDLDQQIMQAEADLASAQANSEAVQMTLQRGQQLIASDAVSQQDLDQRAADAANKQGLVQARRRPMSIACACSSNISASPRRSTGSSPRATPISAR